MEEQVEPQHMFYVSCPRAPSALGFVCRLRRTAGGYLHSIAGGLFAIPQGSPYFFVSYMYGWFKRRVELWTVLGLRRIRLPNSSMETPRR